MSPAALACNEAEHRRLVEEMSLLQLRKARKLTEQFRCLERRTDMYVSTLANYVQAVGADLRIRAEFPDGRAVKFTQFSE